MYFYRNNARSFLLKLFARAFDIDWHPQKFVVSVGSSIAGAIKPAGF